MSNNPTLEQSTDNLFKNQKTQEDDDDLEFEMNMDDDEEIKTEEYTNANKVSEDEQPQSDRFSSDGS